MPKVNRTQRNLTVISSRNFGLDARNIAHQFSERVTQLRMARGLSLRDIERQTGMSSGTVGHIMRGEQTVNLVQLLELQRVFELDSLEELLGPLPSQAISVSSSVVHAPWRA